MVEHPAFNRVVAGSNPVGPIIDGGKKMITEVGRVCRKVKGKDAGKYCVVVERDKNLVLIDGKEIKRKKVNVINLEPLPKVLKIKKGAVTKDVIKELKKEKFI